MSSFGKYRQYTSKAYSGDKKLVCTLTDGICLTFSGTLLVSRYFKTAFPENALKFVAINYP